ncbi:ras guanine nucleotide exchange factor domain-containing protein [Syncephalastrum racemosum]|uniref:Ras guanine nucleotide exchange factor domain-containing protein n=1 Tax=Syncephalastrum racemosum TaxID=13706 RepID=A0A1X2HLD3_SYNRA|nr:ras guanine nucleotide exchange factor domain-containing protein [Syncephalastrum racemosum]
MSKIPILCRVQARYPYKSNDPSSLNFDQGDFIEVLTKLDSGWWDGWCNGTRGWFPSNYVQVFEEYEHEDSAEESEENIKEPTPLWRQSDESGIEAIPRTRNGVPLHRNNEHRLSLPYNDTTGFDHTETPECPSTTSALPQGWSVQMTEDGSGTYFYNHETGEMRSSHPDDISESEYEENASIGSLNDSSEDEDSFEFKSIDSPRSPWEGSTNGISKSEDIASPEKIASSWLKRTTPQGRPYYVNTVTQETTWDKNLIDPETGRLRSAPSDVQTADRPLSASQPASSDRSVRPFTALDANEPLTWNKLSAHIALAIHNLNSAAKTAQKTLFIAYSANIVNAIRTMLITSGTIDKESVHIKTNSVLRAHHRAMMASMSKLILSSQLCADNTHENISKMLSDSNELLLAVRNFISTCQDSCVAVQHMDPKVMSGDVARRHSTEGARAKYALQGDLADNLEAYAVSMHESVDAILVSIRTPKCASEPRSSLAALLFTQFRNLANQTAQFLGIVDDIDFDNVADSPAVDELKHNSQLLSDGLGQLFCWMQNMTDETISLTSIIPEMEGAATRINDPIRDICIGINKLVSERRVSRSLSKASADTKVDQQRHPSAEHLADDSDIDKQSMKSISTNGDNLTWEGTATTEPTEYQLTDDAQEKPETGSASVPALEVEAAPAGDKENEAEDASNPDSPGKATSRKLKKFFGDDAPAAVVAAAKPSVNERPWFLQYDYNPNEIVFNMEGYVKGGTLPALVERLTLHDFLDMNFINTFLLTYRSFCTSLELQSLLEARYNLTPPEGLTDEEMEQWTQKKRKLVRLRVFNVLKNWLELYYNEDDHVILDGLLEFTNTSIRSTLSFSADQLERLIKMRKEDESQGGLKKMVLTLPDPPEPIMPRNRKKFKLMDIDTLEMARQLTIMDFKLYSSIRPVECLDKAWSRDPNDENGNVAVNIRASIEYCNQVTSWVSDSILSQSDIKKRSTIIKYWVQVAEKCRLLNNFNTCMAVLSAFDNSSVGRLKRTWEMVGARTNQTLSQIRKLMGANRNFTEYRAIIHSINPPCIPFLGIYLQDLTFIEDGNPNYLKKSKDLINFAKRAKTAEVIREIQQYQSSLYRLKPVDELQQFIQANLQSTRDEDQLYNESLKLEPREREDEKITRLLQESGFL